MRILGRIGLAVAALTVLSSPAIAQNPRTLEFGIDAQVTFGLDDPNVTVVEVPVGSFRLGFEMAPRVSLEPSLSISSASGGGERVTIWAVGLGMLWHFRDMRSGPYVRPFVDLMGFSSSGNPSDTQFAAGAGIGYKIPVADGRVAWRLEANFAHAFESDTREEGNQIGLRAGLSFFTR